MSSASEEYLVVFETEKEKGSMSFFRNDNLNRINVQLEEISNITTKFHHPGDLYPEEGVARPGHLCAGSSSACFQDCDGNQYSIDEIFYYDENLRGSHYDGKKHWNHETRISKNGKVIDWQTHIAPDHIIPDAPEIRIQIIQNGVPISSNSINRGAVFVE